MGSFALDEIAAYIAVAAFLAFLAKCHYDERKRRKLQSLTSDTGPAIEEEKGDVTPPVLEEGFKRVKEEGIVFDIRVNKSQYSGEASIDVRVLKFVHKSKSLWLVNDCVDRLTKTRAYLQATDELTKAFVKRKLHPPTYSDDFVWLRDASVTNRGFVYPNVWDHLEQEVIRENNTPSYNMVGFQYLFDVPAAVIMEAEQLLIGPGGIFNFSVVWAEQNFYYDVNVTMAEDMCLTEVLKPEDQTRTLRNNFSIKDGFKRNFNHVVAMPSMTRDVIGMMLNKDMTNIPYYGSVFHDQGYLSIQVDMDNLTYLFSTVKGHQLSIDQSLGQYRDSKPSALLASLIDLRTRRDPRLVKTDYGYTYVCNGITVHWYV